MKRFLNLPSPGMAVAFFALLVALGGTAIALPGRNSVDKNDIKKNAVGAKQIKAGGVGSSEARNNSLRGTDINESSLGKVPSAATADNATNATNATNAVNATNAGAAAVAGNSNTVGGQSVVNIDYVAETGGVATQILNAGGLVLTASCTAGDLAVTLTSTSDNAQFAASQFQADDDVEENDSGEINDLDAVDSVDLFDGADSGLDDDANGLLHYRSAAGIVVTVTWNAEETTNQGGGVNDCFFYGHALVG